jgi:hypothetical protein
MHFMLYFSSDKLLVKINSFTETVPYDVCKTEDTY